MMTSETTQLPHSGVQINLTVRAAVGAHVHYTSRDTEAEAKTCRAATVTVPEDDDGQVGLCVTNPGGHEFLTAVKAHHIDETDPDLPRTTEGVSGRQPGTWHWPERV